MSFRAQREILLFKISHIRSRWQVCLLSFRPLRFTQCRLREKSLFRRSNTTEESRSLTVPSLELTLSKAEGLRTGFEMTGVFVVISSAARNLASTLVNEISLIILHIRSGQGSRRHVVSDCFGALSLSMTFLCSHCAILITHLTKIVTISVCDCGKNLKYCVFTISYVFELIRIFLARKLHHWQPYHNGSKLPIYWE